ncbi:TPA: hypothetical protein DIS56_02025 [Candidatus Saccharibacteria bacterium]|nr:MAG: hypothetical protein A3F05_03560 [Candidatus Saccharibacteria bacterium RIFCSPHIGHO2_12_FULL_47_17]HCM51888.1 hypothetical protein [Candidatus Saccharibacteria bacterium]
MKLFESGHKPETDEARLSENRVKPKASPEPPLEKVRGRLRPFGAVRASLRFNLLYGAPGGFGYFGQSK